MSRLRRLKVPHVFALLTGVILVCSLLTYLIPSGNYERIEKSYGTMTRTVVVPGSFEQLPKHYSLRGLLIGDESEGAATPVSALGFLSAIPRGMEEAAEIIFFIFVIGGVFGILQRTGTISAVLHGLLERYRHSAPLLTVALMTAIGIGGSTLGMGEEFIPLVPVFLVVARELGFDRIYGLALVIVAADIGFAAATTNPFTVQIAQGIAELPLGSGMPLRLVFFVTCMSWSILYVIRYGRRIKADPSKSLMTGDEFTLPGRESKREGISKADLWIVIACGVVFAFVVFAVQKMGWWLAEMGGGFLLMGFVASMIGRLSVSDATEAFVAGCRDMVVAALVVGFAKGIQVVLMDGQIMDTLIFSAASVLGHFPRVLAAEGMLLFQTTLNFFIPSGSGQAAVTMPLMAPLADVLGLTRQTAVLAFTCGDGFSNTIIPTSGILMAMLGLSGITYERWLRFMLPLFAQLMLLSGLVVLIAVSSGY